MFKDFDPSLFDDSDFKEDSVREEIIVPILRRLGYSSSGANRIIRSKALLHPFVMIGSKRHPVHIIPDYLLHSDGRPGLVLDAKRPDSKLVKSTHAEQAYSYAIHPEVRVRFYALCSGRQLVAYDIYGIEPVFTIDFCDIDRKWDIIKSVLSPENVSSAFNNYLVPDFGIAALKMGAEIGQQWLFQFTKLQQVSCVNPNLFTMAVGMQVGDIDHLVSFDANRSSLDGILELTAPATRGDIDSRLTPGQSILLEAPIYATLDTIIGKPTRGEHDTFVPFIIRGVRPLEEAAFLAAEAAADSAEGTKQ